MTELASITFFVDNSSGLLLVNVEHQDEDNTHKGTGSDSIYVACVDYI